MSCAKPAAARVRCAQNHLYPNHLRRSPEHSPINPVMPTLELKDDPHEESLKVRTLRMVASLARAKSENNFSPASPCNSVRCAPTASSIAGRLCMFRRADGNQHARCAPTFPRVRRRRRPQVALARLVSRLGLSLWFASAEF